MKREGRLHGNGIAKTSSTTKIFPKSKPIFNSPPPNHTHTHTHNRSKLIGKCGKPRCAGSGCHVCKAKDKAHKGTYKLRSCDVGLNHRLISWRVVDNKGLHQLNYTGVSATQILDHLKNHYYDDEQDFDEDDDDDSNENHVYENQEEEEEDEYGITHLEVGTFDEMEENGIVHCGAEESDDDDDDEMGDFCDVGYFVIEQLDGDEDWCLVGEL